MILKKVRITRSIKKSLNEGFKNMKMLVAYKMDEAMSLSHGESA